MQDGNTDIPCTIGRKIVYLKCKIEDDKWNALAQRRQEEIKIWILLSDQHQEEWKKN